MSRRPLSADGFPLTQNQVSFVKPTTYFDTSDVRWTLARGQARGISLCDP